jgi:excisionase family DNA binding protein
LVQNGILRYRTVQKLGEMSGSTFRINKVCQHCSNMFEAQKVSTKFCSTKCAQRNYKLRAKLQKKGLTEQETDNQLRFSIKSNAVNIEQIKLKEFLTVKEVAALIGCNRKTVYSMINSGGLFARNLSAKKTLIKRSELDRLFENPKQVLIDTTETNEKVNIIDVQKKFGISYPGLAQIIKRNKIETEKRGVYVFVNRREIEKIFS